MTSDLVPQTRKIRDPEIYICHICNTIGTWHDTVSCPCRFVSCSCCYQVGHDYKTCLRKAGWQQSQINFKESADEFWCGQSAQSDNLKIYKRQVESTSKDFCVDRVIELDAIQQIELAKRCEMLNTEEGVPDLATYLQLIVSNKVANKEYKAQVPDRHSFTKLYCPSCRLDHANYECVYRPQSLKPFQSKGKFEQSLNVMIKNQKGKLKRHTRFIIADHKLQRQSTLQSEE